MASGTRTSVDFTFHNLSVPISRSGSYGLSLEGNSPVMICGVTRGSVADQAGARVGDFLIALNGKDVQFSTEDDISVSLKYSYGSALMLRVGRPHPLPGTDLEKRKALITLQTKLRSGDYVTCGDEVEQYKSKVANALDNVEDILGGFDLPDQRVPVMGSGTDQEVEIKMYDSDSLSSPPSSEGSEVNVEYDPLLDFTREDDLVHNAGTTTTGADLAKNVLQMQKNIQGMKQIMKETSEAKERKRRLREQAQITPSVRTEASFTPTYPSNDTRTQPSAVGGAKRDVRKERDSFDEQLQWVQSPLTSGGGVSSGHVTSGSRQSQPSKQAPKRTEKSPPPRQPERSVSPPAPKYKSEGMPSGNQQREAAQTFEPASKAPDRRITEQSPPPKQPAGPTRREKSPTSTDQPASVTRGKSPTSKEQPASVTRRGKSPTSKAIPSADISVPLRQKKKVSDKLPSSEQEGYVEDDLSTKGRKKSFEPPQVNEEITGLDKSVSGLPTNVYDWRKNEVGQWIKQLSVSLYAHYFPVFSKHDITGRSLLRLTSTKLKSMGISNAVHCRILATEIAKLKIRQEKRELTEMQQPSDDDDNELTYL